MIKCVLFDGDGTLGILSDERYPWTFTAYRDTRAVFDAIKAMGYAVGIITNQSSISRGTGVGYDFDEEFRGFGADIWEICPHDNHHNCDCRKPRSGLLLRVCERLGITPSECIVVGDRITDVQCAVNVGARAVFVTTGKGMKDLPTVRELYPDVDVLDCYDGVLELL